MYAQESIFDLFFTMLYGAVAMLTLTAALYLLFRRANAFAPGIETPAEVRRWTSTFLFTATASHVWWYVFGTHCLTDDRMVRNAVLIALDHVTLVPLVIAVLLRMLQDCRRRLWPWLVAELPILVMAVAGIATHDDRAISWMNGWQTVVIVSFIARYFFALKDYRRWLEQNFADLEHKDIWKSMLVAAALGVVYEIYCINPGLMPAEYMTQLFTIIITVFLVWRVETLQTLTPEAESTEQPMPSVSKSVTTSAQDFGPQLHDYCETTQLYLQPDLTLAQLAQVLCTNRTYLSAYFAQAGTTYNAYINQLRIEHFERRYAETLSASGQVAATAKALAAESGFSSYSTFSTAFKKHRGITVAEWMRQQASPVR